VLVQAAQLAADPLLQLSIQHLQGSMELWGGDRITAHGLLLDAAARLESLDPARATAVLVDTALAYQMDGDVSATMSAVLRAEALARRTPNAIDMVPLVFTARILAGEGRAVRQELGAHVRRYVERDEAGKDLFVPVWFAHALTWIDEYGDARRMFDREVADARANGSLGVVPFSLACLAEIDFRVGRWDACDAGLSEAVRLSEDTGQVNLFTFCLVTLARLEAARGKTDACRAHVRQSLELALRLGVGSLRGYALSAGGLLELGLGNVIQAVSILEQLAAVVERQGLREPGVVHWRSDLVEAYALAGRVEDARRTLDALDEEAERTDRLWARAAAERCRGMLEDDFEGAFSLALELHERLPMPFERARTQLRLGERLRRARRGSQAREPLHEALVVFESLGAEPWARQARAELAATGERLRSGGGGGLPELTPQELRIAVLVAQGATNREAAAALFLSPKTVGYHLGKVYEKLGINSRSQLAALVARGEAEIRTGGPPAASKY
jgi:DNA-binding CsgD family transcriptional regulator